MQLGPCHKASGVGPSHDGLGFRLFPPCGWQVCRPQYGVWKVAVEVHAFAAHSDTEAQLLWSC